MKEIDYDKCKGECGNVSYKDLTRLLKYQQRWIAKAQKIFVRLDKAIKNLKADLAKEINQREKEENDKPTKGKK